MYPIFKGTLLSSILAVILAGVLVSALELSGDDIHANELLSAFIRIFAAVFIV